jgi:SAM-dependent methyltransferase
MELAYWRNASRAESDARQRKILELWGFDGADSVLELGPGPWGGCLPFIDVGLKIAVEPLYLSYKAIGLLDYANGPTQVWPSIRDIGVAHVDDVISMNALDHGDGDFSVIERIAALLTAGGRFYLHVHLRTPDQLNVGHDHPLYLEDLDAAIAAAGLREIKKDVYEVDPVEGCAYRTVIGVWEK